MHCLRLKQAAALPTMPWGGGGQWGGSKHKYAKMNSSRFKAILKERHMARFIAKLELSAHDVYEFFTCFCRIDKDCSGSIELDEFFDFMDLDYSRFAARAFSSMDVHHGVGSAHTLHFPEFLVGM